MRLTSAANYDNNGYSCAAKVGCHTNHLIIKTISKRGNRQMQTQNIPGAPPAIGPYSHAIKVRNLVFCSGQTPLDPETKELVGTDIKQQTKRVLKNLAIVLNGLGLSLQNVVKTTVFLKDMADFQGMNEVYAEMFGTHQPARTTISVKQNPLDALVEIECIAELQE
jgi:2-iminobutanoate/2-iminopropanoate deaminase